MNNKYRMDMPPLTEATIRLYVGGDEVHTASMGDGPVNAIDRALRKALTRFYPVPGRDGADRLQGTGPFRRTWHRGQGAGPDREQGQGIASWGTVGVSLNIIEASWQALVDSINYKLMKDETKKGLRKRLPAMQRIKCCKRAR